MTLKSLNKGIIICLPMLAFLAVYLLSDIFGAIVLFLRLEPFYSIYVYHSGISLPARLDADQMRTFWLIALGGPTIMLVGFLAAFLPASKNLQPSGPAKQDFDPPFLLALMVFAAFVCFGMLGIYKGGAFSSLWAWGNYADLVEARWKLYATLSFFEFANLYQFIPVTATVALLVSLRQRGWMRVVGIMCALIAVSVGILIFQKKIVVTSMIMITSALVIYGYLVDPKRVGRLIGGAVISVLALLIVFFIASVVPTLIGQTSVINNSGNTKQEVDFVSKLRELDSLIVDGDLEGLEQELDHQADVVEERPFKQRPGEKRKLTAQQLAEYRKELAEKAWEVASRSPYKNSPLLVATVNLTMRTSVSAVYYIAVFPDLHPYFSLDLGQDILGYGEMPNDNLVVWNAMYPDMPGAVAAPFNFVLYSQGGLRVAFIVSAVVGLLIGLIWAVILKAQGATALRAALGAVVVVGTMHLSLDALRNTIIVSYGFAWGLVPLLLLLLITGIWRWLRHSRKGAVVPAD